MPTQPQPGTDFSWSSLTNLRAGLIVLHCFCGCLHLSSELQLEEEGGEERERKEVNRGKMIRLSANLRSVYQTDGTTQWMALLQPGPRAGGYFGNDEQFAPLIRGHAAYTGHMLITT